MAQLGEALRISFTSYRCEDEGGLFCWPGKNRDKNIVLDWRAETPASGTIAEGSISLAEVMWWQTFFEGTREVLSVQRRKGIPDHDPVARLWTPLAGQTVEFFVWKQPDNELAILALFSTDASAPEKRIAVETSATYAHLGEFGKALVREAQALSAAG